MTATLTPRLTTLTPAHSQRIFRTCLDVLARPGTVGTWAPEWTAAVTRAEAPVALAPLLALADLMAPVAAVPEAAGSGPQAGSQTRAWVQEIARLSGAPLVDPAGARLALALGRPDPAALAELNRSTAAAPHRAALLIQRVTDLGSDLDTAGTSATGTSAERTDLIEHTDHAERPDRTGDPASALVLRLTGPGIADTAQLRITGLDREFFTIRDRLVADFPAGIDVLFVTDDGRVAGLPRTTAIRAEEIS
ncbi:alpha-D-ribose 1-methylphosphonate 5-triphosphate synthase subunit PhnH [Brevibacterium pityocampae]